MAKGKSTKQSGKAKSAARPTSSKAQPASGGTRSSTTSTRSPVSGSKAKSSTTQRQAFMRGARSRGGLGVWGLVGLLGVLVVFAVLYFTGSLTSDSADNPQTGLPAEISLEEAYALYPDGAFFLDVREAVEWDAGHAPDTTNIPLSELESRLDEVPTDQDIVVICRSGNRSVEGRKILRAAGFENVTSMADGLRDWKAAGYPFEGDVLED